MTTSGDNGGRTGIMVLVVLGFALLGVVGYAWRSWRKNTVVPEARPISSFIVNWECLGCRHREEHPAGPGPRECPKCHKERMYAVIQWTCPNHGVRPVFFQYEDGEPKEVAIDGEKWIPAIDQDGGWNIRCPVCGSAMAPAEAPRSVDDEPGA